MGVPRALFSTSESETTQGHRSLNVPQKEKGRWRKSTAQKSKPRILALELRAQANSTARSARTTRALELLKVMLQRAVRLLRTGQTAGLQRLP
jgi:hypothetical protein